MPYITEEHRDRLHPITQALHDAVDQDGMTPGELNYIVTKAAQAFMEANGTGYAAINSVLGAFEAAKQEFYRRIAAPYEDIKIAQNGDVYS